MQLRDTISPCYICGDLYKNNALDEKDFIEFLESKDATPRSTELFLLRTLPKQCTFETFREIISIHYDFLLEDIDKCRQEYRAPERPVLNKIETKARLIAVKQYYDIKRKHWNGNIEDFETFLGDTNKTYEARIESIRHWNKLHSKNDLTLLNDELTMIADMYFKSMILKWRHEIGKTNPTLARMKELRSILQDIIPKTSVPQLYTMSVCGQYALAMRAVGDIDEASRNIYVAKQLSAEIPNCREKLSILSTESNTEWERSARQGLIDGTEKERLIGLVKESRIANRELNKSQMECQDELRAAADFDNATIIVEALIRVGIDDKGRNLAEVDVTKQIYRRQNVALTT